MKGRPKNIRRISSIPIVSGFKPYGNEIGSQKHTAVFLNYEEYEALRLNDYEKNTQCESAAIMGVSRPTFTRIYMCAREKIAKAFIEGCRIIIEGGKVKLNDQWRVCRQCGAIFSIGEEKTDNYTCALCGSNNIETYNDAKESNVQQLKITEDVSLCGHKKCGGRKCGRKRYFNNK